MASKSCLKILRALGVRARAALRGMIFVVVILLARIDDVVVRL